MKNGNGREPEVLAVDLKSWDGVEVHLENDGIMTSRDKHGHTSVSVEVHLENDGIMTSRTVDEPGSVDLMQTRSAFRDFVMGMVALMNYTIVEAYGVEQVSVDE